MQRENTQILIWIWILDKNWSKQFVQWFYWTKDHNMILLQKESTEKDL
jgi:hypothetical protein